LVPKNYLKIAPIVVLALVFALLIPLFFKGSYVVVFLIITGIWVMFATSLRIIMTLGLVSFAHNGFFAIGAYASAVFMMRLGFSFWLAMPLSGIVAAFLALVIGFPMLRTKGHYFFLSSFALGMVIVLMFATQWRGLFGGTMGIANIPHPSDVFRLQINYYYLVLGLTVLTISVVYRIDNCRIGKEWRAIRELDDLAALIGINIVRAKIVAFVLASFFAGISGSLLAHYLRFISPEAFGFPAMLFCLSSVIIGGMNSTWGPAVGVVLLRTIMMGVGGLKEWEILIYSAMLILCVVLLPLGVVSLPSRIMMLMRKKEA